VYFLTTSSSAVVVDEEGSEDDGGNLKDGEEEERRSRPRGEIPDFARDAAGRRAKRIAEIADYLPKVEPKRRKRTEFEKQKPRARITRRGLKLERSRTRRVRDRPPCLPAGRLLRGGDGGDEGFGLGGDRGPVLFFEGFGLDEGAAGRRSRRRRLSGTRRCCFR